MSACPNVPSPGWTTLKSQVEAECMNAPPLIDSEIAPIYPGREPRFFGPDPLLKPQVLTL
jgi:hypothetical protein